MMYIHSNNEMDKRINVSKKANDISVLYLLGRKQQMLKLVHRHLVKTNTDSLVAKSTVYVNNFVVKSTVIYYNARLQLDSLQLGTRTFPGQDVSRTGRFSDKTFPAGRFCLKRGADLHNGPADATSTHCLLL